MVAALLSTVVAIGGLTGCGGGGSSSTIQTNDKGEITELVEAVQPESGEYDPAGAAAYEYFSVQTECYEGLYHTMKMVRFSRQLQIIGMLTMKQRSILLYP